MPRNAVSRLNRSAPTPPRTTRPAWLRRWVFGIRQAALIGMLALLLPQAGLAGEGFVGGGIPFEEADASGFPAKTYFRVTRIDMRLCPSPVCGGVFVERVNRGRTRCADGEFREECHAAVVDLSALGLSPSEEAQLLADFGNQQVLARGELEAVDLGIGIEVPTLVVSDAWRAETGSQAKRGRYWGVVTTGIVCITYPCPTMMRLKLNGRRVNWLHGIDLSESGASQQEIAEAIGDIQVGPGLIVFGRKRPITGPAGDGIELVGSEFFRKVGPRPGPQ